MGVPLGALPSSSSQQPQPQQREHSTMSKQLDPWINMTGGAVSGMIAVTASYPFDLLKTRLHLEVQKGNRPTMIDTTKLIFREGYNTCSPLRHRPSQCVSRTYQ